MSAPLSRNALSVILFLSLALNGMFIAYNGVRLWQSNHIPSHDEIINLREDSFATLLPSNARLDLEAQLATKKGEIRYHMHAMKVLRSRIRKLLEQEPIDEAALVDAFSAIRLEHDLMQKIYHDTFVNVTKKLDVNQRKRVTRSLHERHDTPDTPDDKDKD